MRMAEELLPLRAIFCAENLNGYFTFKGEVEILRRTSSVRRRMTSFSIPHFLGKGAIHCTRRDSDPLLLEDGAGFRNIGVEGLDDAAELFFDDAALEFQG